jgi:hypothetical protein
MEEEMDKGMKKEAMDPSMMEEYQIKKIMENLERDAVKYPTKIK